MKARFFLVIFLVTLVFSSCTIRKGQNIEAAKITHDNGQITSISGTFQVSGVYPHLTTYTHARLDGMQSYAGINPNRGQRECGIGALVYVIDKKLEMEIFQGSVGGTPACRMVHQESEQLFIGHYAIDKQGDIRVIPIEKMPGRMTAVARHLNDPANKVYYYDMEGAVYEVDVHTLEPTLLYKNPLPGWHGKGAYTSQGLLVLANNGEHYGSFEPTEHWKVDTAGVYGPENYGVLASYDGKDFKIIERRQYTDVTTRHGVNAVPNDKSPLWSMGWDKRSVRLKVLDNGQWYTYLMPKATTNNDPSHGWFTEWPRIREIHDGNFLMDMHGMFFDFPSTFSYANSKGIKPIGSHLRYIPDFVYWNGSLVLATDETSIQGNPLAGQAQSNLWFGSYEDLKEWGPASGYGSVWVEDEVMADEPSLPYLFNGFANRMVHLVNHGDEAVDIKIEFDKEGNNQWSLFRKITLPSDGYDYVIFNKDIQAQWIRLTSNKNTRLTATFHYTDDKLHNPEEGHNLFAGLARNDYKGDVSHSKLYSNHDNFNLTVHQGQIVEGRFVAGKEYELDKYALTYEAGLKDSTSLKALDEVILWSEDEASVVLNTGEGRLRLPKGKGMYYPRASRNVREVQSERELANIHGTFYELPLFRVGQEALYSMMRPVATHNRQITDFNTWNGLLVMSGVRMDAKSNPNIVKEKDVALWIGGIDDIWKFGKPVGEGGVWKNTRVEAGKMSDRYLMTGYDKKTLELIADKDAEIELYLHTTHYTDRVVPFKTFQLKAGVKTRFEFPEGFSAHWAQLKADTDCVATAWFIYE